VMKSLNLPAKEIPSLKITRTWPIPTSTISGNPALALIPRRYL
jgi:hypothetical protein